MEVEGNYPPMANFVYVQTPEGLIPVPVYTPETLPSHIQMPREDPPTYVSESLMKETISSQRKIADKVFVRN